MRKAMVVLTAALVSVSMVGVGSVRAQESARSVKRSPVSLHLASMTPVKGFKQMTLDRDQTVYVSPKAVLSGGDVASTEAVETRGGVDMLLSVKEEAAKRFGKLLRTRATDRLAVLSGGRLIGVGSVSFNAGERVATITGLSSTQAQRVAKVLGSEVAVPVGAMMTVVPAQRTLSPGESMTLDVFVNGVPSLRGYQAALAVTGGASGSVAVTDLWIQKDRPDYVFGKLDKLDAVDRVGARLGGVLMDGGVDATGPLYLGSYTVQASADASGTFRINIRDDDSDLRNPQSFQIRFAPGPDATITVGASPRATDK